MHDALHISEHPVTGWQITDSEGQHTAWVSGELHDAVAHAHRLLGRRGIVTTDDDL